MYILFAISLFGMFLFGVIITEKKYKKIVSKNFVEYEKQYRELQLIFSKHERETNAAWEKHCKAIREQYQNALIQKNGKCACEEKVLYQDKYEIDPCAYKIKEKYHNVTIEVLECKKCGHTEISWFRQDDTEEVEVE